MDTVALPRRRGSSKLVKPIHHLQYARTMKNLIVANGDIGNPAKRTGVFLVNWRQQNREARLTKTTPHVFEHVALEQNSLGILQFEMILDDKGIVAGAADKVGLPRSPVHWIK